VRYACCSTRARSHLTPRSRGSNTPAVVGRRTDRRRDSPTRRHRLMKRFTFRRRGAALSTVLVAMAMLFVPAFSPVAEASTACRATWSVRSLTTPTTPIRPTALFPRAVSMTSHAFRRSHPLGRSHASRNGALLSAHRTGGGGGAAPPSRIHFSDRLSSVWRPSLSGSSDARCPRSKTH
jgi:hypothetical protein